MSKVYLRAQEPEDYKVSIAWRKDAAIWPLLGGTKYFVSEAYEKKWVENAIFGGNDIKLAICDSETDTYIGNSQLNKIDKINRSADIGILIGDKQYRRGGRGTDAVRQMLSYAFGELGLHRITALILEENTASRRTFSKLGFTEEGMYRDSVFKGRKYRNQVIISLLDYEYFKNNI